MKISTKGLNLIKEFEGCYLKAYQDSGGVWTIGIGITNADKAITGKTIKAGLKITQSTADKWLLQALDKIYIPKVMKYDHIYHWNQNQFDALVIGGVADLFAELTPVQMVERFCYLGETGNIHARYLAGKKIGD